MRLVIVESPTKAKTLKKFLGEKYEVLSSMGHVYDLPKKELGVDVENDFAPKYIPLPKKKKIISELKKAASEADEVYIATDPDREGESIAWHIKNIVGDSKTKRVSFHEITKSAVEESFKDPRDINQNLVDSQQARRVLDRLVGYKLSPLLWRKIRYGLSAGRVQSVAVRVIVEREREREAFHPEEYWEIEAKLGRESGEQFTAKLVEKEGKKIEIGIKGDSDSVVRDLEDEKYTVSKVKKSERKKNPYPPYITSTLQQAGVNVLGFSSSRTMRVAQSLYEAGFITYHRTDSTTLSSKALTELRDFIGSNFGSNYLPGSAINYKTKVRLAQEAHEAIRPTDVSRAPEAKEVATLGKDQARLYDLIWKRTVSCQMLPAVYEQISADIAAGVYVFRATGSKLIFEGWEKVYAVDGRRAIGEKDEKGIMPKLETDERLKLVELLPSQHFTAPPARYTEATLIKQLEEEGIGRPSTYAPIIRTIQDRGYVIKEGRSLKPDDVGIITNDLLVAYFPDIVDLSFTAKIEDDLDNIAQGKEIWVEPIRRFYGPFEEELVKAEKNIDKSSMTTIKELDEKCPDCGKPLLIKLGRYGKFYSCSTFPDCKYARPYVEEIGMKCPDCKEGDVVVRRTKKRGRIFYGCSRFPKCKWASWKDPRNPEEDKD